MHGVIGTTNTRLWSGLTMLALVGTTMVATAPSALADSPAATPRPDHVVVVVEEGQASSQVLGSSSAPYLNSLAHNGALMTASYAITHPSRPNYLALFSGSTQGVTDDSCPQTFDAPNLGGALIAAGLSYATYSEDLPSAGFTGCTAGAYARKHNPSVDFAGLPASTNLPMTAFPTDFSTLPTVSFVVPNLRNDMHDGTISQADLWLQNNIGAYATWARTHNSLLIVTFDEDDYTQGNRIPTIISGAGVVPGSYDELINHYSVLRTLEDAYGLAPIGASATASAIQGIWGAPGDLPPQASFQPSCTGLSCSLDGTSSSDPDGTVASFAWTFGDGTSGSGPTTSHAYGGPGSYVATLTVTDDQGMTGTYSVLLALNTTTASDAFTRTVAGGWGTADAGGAWTVSGAATQYAVGGGVGTIRVGAGSGPSAYLNAVSSSDTDLQMTVSVDKLATGSGLYLSVVGRRIVGAGDYRVKLRLTSSGAVSAVLERVSPTGAETLLGPDTVVSGLTYAPGAQLRVRLQVTGTGPTALRAMVWRAGAPPPASWLVATTDSTSALQTAGSVGSFAYLSSGANNAPLTVSYDDLVAQPTSGTPTASFTQACTNSVCAFDASGSVTPNGSIVSYVWAFGDGSTGLGLTPSYSYLAAGTYPVTLTVTDKLGRTASSTVAVTVTAPVPPTASFTSSCSALSCSFDGSGSSAANGSVVGYAWAYGDGDAGAGASATHTFVAAGTYQVALTVTDTFGRAGTTTVPVLVSLAVGAPTASFSFSCTGLSCVFDGSGSKDPGGSVVSYAWVFGDGATGSGSGPTHVFAAGGLYPVTLAVTDNDGLTGSVTASVSVTAPAPPTASFSFSCTGLSCVFDGSGSKDPGGSVVSYAWVFGDGATGSGSGPTHVFAAGGSYPVTLAVTDNDGLTGSVTASVSVTTPVTLYASDSFARTVDRGWGIADLGGPWTLGTSSSKYAVSGGYGTIAMTSAGSGASVLLNSVSATSTDVQVTLTSNKVPSGGGTYLSVIGRQVAGVGDYRAQVLLMANGRVGLSVMRQAPNGVGTLLAPLVTVAGLTFTPGTQLRVRLEVTGTVPTTVRAKVWSAASAEPAGWQRSGTDSTAGFQVAGSVGFQAYLSSSAKNAPVLGQFTNFQAGPAN